MKTKECIVEYGLHDVEQVVSELSGVLASKAIVTFVGSLGAGKTTFISALLRLWGVKEPVVSPTFSYVNMYTTSCGMKIYHFDLYRLDNLESFEHMGFAEYLYNPNSICLIEWPEIVMPLITSSFCHINIDFEEIHKRRLIAQISNDKEEI